MPQGLRLSSLTNITPYIYIKLYIIFISFYKMKGIKTNHDDPYNMGNRRAIKK